MVERRGEYFYDFLLWDDRIRTQLYQDGFNNVPMILLGENKFYGTRIGEEGIRIYIDDYFRVNGEIRRRIREDIRYKINLHHTTWSILHEFETVLKRFVSAVNHGNLTSEEWSKVCDEHIKLLALLEMNFCLPTVWYNETLAELTKDSMREETYSFNDMSYSEVTPYAIQVRNARLELAMKYHRGTLTKDDCEHYMETVGVLDGEITQKEEPYSDRVMEAMKEMCESATESELMMEIETIRKMRSKAKETYLNKLVHIANEMDYKQYSKEKSCNLFLALNIISLAATEEEYRHILQWKFFFYTNKLLRNLDLPINISSVQDVSEALKLRENRYVRK